MLPGYLVMSFVIIVSLAFLFGTAQSQSCTEEKELAEAEYEKILSVTGELEYFYVPECEGELWKPLQRDRANLRWCVDVTSGEVLSQKSEHLTSCSGCLAERLKIMYDVETAEAAGANANNVYFPECQDVYPEYYQEKQCWVGYFNACWCVHEATGHAISLPMENETSCKSTGKPVTWCLIMKTLVSNYFRAYYEIKGTAADTGDFTPDIKLDVDCDNTGSFAKEQCLGGVCWCVDPDSGMLTQDDPECHQRNKRSTWNICEKDKGTQFEAYYHFMLRGVMLEHFTIPKCTSAGEWDYIQCSNQTVGNNEVCWCVNQLTGKPTTFASTELKSCTTCRATRMRREMARGAGPEDYTTCDESGEYYTVIQCNQEGECWCVDRETGAVLLRGGDVTGERCEVLGNRPWN